MPKAAGLEVGDATKPVFWSLAPDGVRVAVKVHPRSRRSGLGAVIQSADGPRLKISVNEAPEDGKASRAACHVMASAVGLPPSAVQVIVGATSREKLLLLSGDPEDLVARLRALG